MMVVRRNQNHIWFSHLLKEMNYGFHDPASHLIRKHLSMAFEARSCPDCIPEQHYPLIVVFSMYLIDMICKLILTAVCKELFEY